MISMHLSDNAVPAIVIKIRLPLELHLEKECGIHLWRESIAGRIRQEYSVVNYNLKKGIEEVERPIIDRHEYDPFPMRVYVQFYDRD